MIPNPNATGGKKRNVSRASAHQAQAANPDGAGHRPVQYGKPAKVIAEGEWELLLDAARWRKGTQGARQVAILLAMYRAGLRQGEVVWLRVDEVYLDPTYPRFEIRDSKFGKSRNVPIDPRILPDLIHWANNRPNDSEWFFCTTQLSPGGVSKGNPPGARITNGFVWSMLDRLCKRAGIRHINPHMLRHTCATNWLRAGFSVEEVRVLLGHEHLHTTQKYLHVDHMEIHHKMGLLEQFEHVRPNQTRLVARLSNVFDAPESVPAAMPAVTPAPMVAPIAPIAANADGRVPCPTCAELVQAAAVFCKHCRCPIIRAG